MLEWIVELRAEEYLGTFTPVVEDHLDLDMDIDTDWSDGNIPAYLAMLVDEINEKTEFDLRLQPWREYSKVETRIRVKRKSLGMEKLIRDVQLLGLSRNKVLDATRIQSTLDLLLSQ